MLMPNISISTDTSLSFDETKNVVDIQISNLEGNVLHINASNQLYTDDISMFTGTWYPMNGINGRVGVPMARIECNSSVTRLCNYNEMTGDLHTGDIWDGHGCGVAPETGDMDGVNIDKLFASWEPGPNSISTSTYLANDTHPSEGYKGWSGEEYPSGSGIRFFSNKHYRSYFLSI